MRVAPRVLVALVVLLPALVALVRPAAPPAANTAAQAMLQEINRVRAEHGLRPLRRDTRLVRAARWQAEEMLRRGSFEHGDFRTRIRRFGARGPRFGENLAWGAGRSGSPQALVEVWMQSPGHRANLLRRGWRRVGIGVAVGTFSGYADAIIVAADFAGR